MRALVDPLPVAQLWHGGPTSDFSTEISVLRNECCTKPFGVDTRACLLKVLSRFNSTTDAPLTASRPEAWCCPDTNLLCSLRGCAVLPGAARMTHDCVLSQFFADVYSPADDYAWEAFM
jgi:hypothetical protein